MTDENKKKISFPGLIAGAAASIVSMILGSAFGLRGTIYGAAIGSIVYGVTAVITENHLLKSRDKLRDTFHPDDEDATSLIPLVKVKRSQRRKVLLLMGVVMILVPAAAAYGLLGVVKGATGRTLGNYAPRPAVTVTPVTSTPSQVITPLPDETPSPSATIRFSGSPVASPDNSPPVTPYPSSSSSLSPSPQATISPSPSLSLSSGTYSTSTSTP